MDIAVVGHTNTGKTSLMRTLLRDDSFGQVSDRPGVTRSVAAAQLLIDDQPALRLFDTPGMEDSIALLDLLDRQQRDRNTPQRLVIQHVIDQGIEGDRFAQEYAVLRQVLVSDLILYVVDARDRVHGKHRDELEILRRCARPVVPVLNFVEKPDARLEQWRTELAHGGLHAVAEFDTVVFDAVDELQLFEKWRTLLDEFGGTIDALIESRRAERAQLTRNSLRMIAQLLIDVAGFVRTVPIEESSESEAAINDFKDVVRDREARFVRQLLDLHHFDPAYWKGVELPIEDGAWGLDLFSAEALKQFGIRTGSAAGAGALAGLAVDALLGGLSFGAAAATGAAIGATWSTIASHGRRLLDRSRGRTELRCALPTVQLLQERSLALLRALLSRGHASVEPIHADPASNPREDRQLRELLARAGSHPDWSALNQQDGAVAAMNGREPIEERLMERLSEKLTLPAAAS